MIYCLSPKLICVVEIDLNFKNYKSDFIKKELNLPYSTDMEVHQLISKNLSAIATFNNERLKDLQRQRIQAAKKNGKYFGQKTVINKKLISHVQDLKENKNLSITEISKITFPTIDQSKQPKKRNK